MTTTIGFIGAGSMGEALVSGMIEDRLFKPQEIVISDPDQTRQKKLETEYGVQIAADNHDLVTGVESIVLAVKPKVVDRVLDQIGAEISSNQRLFSIAAGVSIARLEEYLTDGLPVVRLMPNTPALIREGAVAYSLGSAADESTAKLVEELFSAVGLVVETEEKLMDAVTGLSGSGPAYIYVLIEALADAGVYEGLERETALQLAAQTVSGAAKMVTELEDHPGQLKDLVTSPGGTTITGLKELEAAGFRSTLYQAVRAATERSNQLGGE